MIDEGNTVNWADSVVGDRALSFAVIVTLPGKVGGVVIKTINLPVLSDLGCDDGVMSVPLNDKWINDVCAKPTPDTLSKVPGTPDVGLSVIDGDSTVNVADSVVVALSFAVIVAFPGRVVGVVIIMLNIPVAEDFR